MLSFKDSVLKAIDEYNKYRSPEAKAKPIKINEKELVIDFEGSFCQTCGYLTILRISSMNCRNLLIQK
jgi:hypothetical protein